jgi:hypothetical protein
MARDARARSFAVATVAACAFLVGAAPAAAQSIARFSLDSVVAVDVFGGESVSNRPQIIVDVSAAMRLGDNWQFYVRPWLRKPRPDTQLYQGGVRYEHRGEVSSRVDAGYILSPIGLGVFDTRPGINPTIAPHISYLSPMPLFDPTGPRVSAIAATYPLGAQLTVSASVWDARAAVINSAPTRIYALGAATNPRQTPVFAAGGGVTPTVGLRVGAAVARGIYATAEEITTRPADGREMRRGRVGVQRHEDQRRDRAHRVSDLGGERGRIRMVRPGHADALAALVRGGAAREHVRPAADQWHHDRDANAPRDF